MSSVLVLTNSCPKFVRQMMSSLKQEKSSPGKSIENSPNHGFARFGFTCKRRIIFWWIFLNALATMPLKSKSCCTFSNQDFWLNFSSKVWVALFKLPEKSIYPSDSIASRNLVQATWFYLNKSWTTPSWILPRDLWANLMHHPGGGPAPLWVSVWHPYT